MAYTDIGGLYQEWGLEQTTTHKGGEYSNVGQLREIELKITLSTLTEAETILDRNIFMPAGMRIAEVEVRTETAAATGVAIDLGLVQTNAASTEIDYNGILDAFPTASMNAAGETVVITAVGAGTGGPLVGTTTANVGHFTCSRTTATAFTAGVIYVKVRYYKP